MLNFKSLFNNLSLKFNLRLTTRPTRAPSPLTPTTTFTSQPAIKSVKASLGSSRLKTPRFTSFFAHLLTLFSNTIEEVRVTLLNTWKCLAGEGFIQIKVVCIVFIADALISDDEPL